MIRWPCITGMCHHRWIYKTMVNFHHKHRQDARTSKKHRRSARTANKTNTMQTTLCWAFLRPRENHISQIPLADVWMTLSLAKMINQAESDQTEWSGHHNTKEAFLILVGKDIGRQHQNMDGQDICPQARQTQSGHQYCTRSAQVNKKTWIANSISPGCD